MIGDEIVKRVHWFNVFLLCLTLVSLPASGQDVVYVVGDSLLTFNQGNGPLKVPYFANHSLGETNEEIERLIIVQHGTLRNADNYYQSIINAADGANLPDWQESTLVIAPQFLTEEDVNFLNLGNDFAYWSYMGWRQGDLSGSTSSHPRPWRISSYAVADSIISRAVQTFPNLKNVVVAGHSAGGQFVNRFTAGSHIHEELEAAGISIRGIVSNPSTYMYLSPKRYNAGGSFSVPSAGQISSCPSYDNYKYGMINPSSYMDQGAEVLRTNYRSREVVYLLGDLDNQVDMYLDVSCPANFQGPYRRERGRRYLLHLVDEFGAGIRTLHREVGIAGVGHNHSAIFASACGVRYLFDFGTCHDAMPECSVTPASISETMAPGDSRTVWLTLANTGETGSLVSYNLELNDPVPLPRGLLKSGRSMSGSTVSVSPNRYEPGGTLEVAITVTNGSPDDEWLSGVSINFPSGISIVSASAMTGSMHQQAPYSGQYGDGATAVWNGELAVPGESATANLTLEFTSVGGDVRVPYQVSGDGYGAPPHSVSGEFVFETTGPFVHLSSPNGGEICRQGTTWPLAFSVSSEVDNVDIELRRGSEDWQPLCLGLDAENGQYLWEVAGDLGLGYSLRISDSSNAALSDTCDARFTVGRSLSWVTLDQVQGNINAGDQQNIGVTLEAGELPAGIYQAEVIVLNNAGESQAVPVSMEITGPPSAVDSERPDLPDLLSLQAAPNPFNPRTRLVVAMMSEGPFELSVYDAAGSRVRKLAGGYMQSGKYNYTWDGCDDRGAALSSGIYFARLISGPSTIIRKLVLVR